MNLKKLSKFDFVFIGAGAATTQFFANTSSEECTENHPIMSQFNIAILDAQRPGQSSLAYNIEANNALKYFFINAKGIYKKVIPAFTDDELDQNPILDEVVAPIYSKWSEILDSQIKQHEKTQRFYLNADSLMQNEDDSWSIKLSNGEIIQSRKIVLATGGIKKSVLSEQTVNSYKQKVQHSEDFQKPGFGKRILASSDIAILGSSHSAVSAIKLIHRLNPDVRITVFYRHYPEVKNVSSYYKPFFESIFYERDFSENVTTRRIDKLSEVEEVLNEFDYVVEATGYSPVRVPIYDQNGEYLECTQKPNCKGEICFYQDQERIVVLKNLYGMGLTRPVFGINTEVKETENRVLEGVSVSGEFDIIREALVTDI